ncbi:MAG: hypothetical protein JO171_19640 [Paludibacterium sp.]|uniref:hypothetical protein n=1 Tax=Paludibacterium sp. TaxID=1917523 RepID=UPI0025E2F729|nr:hypothetical protein [Paludibacterium sp.]MBV8049371.1 hypothetical protein [Paludibacterium sp.]
MNVTSSMSSFQRDLRDIQHTLNLLVAQMSRARSSRSRHTASLLAVISYKLAYLEQAVKN